MKSGLSKDLYRDICWMESRIASLESEVERLNREKSQILAAFVTNDLQKFDNVRAILGGIGYPQTEIPVDSPSPVW